MMQEDNVKVNDSLGESANPLWLTNTLEQYSNALSCALIHHSKPFYATHIQSNKTNGTAFTLTTDNANPKA